MISCFYTCNWNLGTPNVQIVSKNNVETLHMRMLRKLTWNPGDLCGSAAVLLHHCQETTKKLAAHPLRDDHLSNKNDRDRL